MLKNPPPVPTPILPAPIEPRQGVCQPKSPDLYGFAARPVSDSSDRTEESSGTKATACPTTYQEAMLGMEKRVGVCHEERDAVTSKRNESSSLFRFQKASLSRLQVGIPYKTLQWNTSRKKEGPSCM